jgi:hypothetical protein
MCVRVEASGTGHLEVFDRSGKAGLSVAAHDAAHAELVVYDEAHAKRLVFGMVGGVPAVLVGKEPGAELAPLSAAAGAK